MELEISALLAYFRQISFVTDKVGVGLLLIFEVTPWLKNPAPPMLGTRAHLSEVSFLAAVGRC